MTTTTDHATAEHAAHTPSYAGPGAVEILGRLRAFEVFISRASTAVQHRDVARALDDTRCARAELQSIEDALVHATPAARLDHLAREDRRITLDWQPDPTRGGDPLVDVAQADPVLVSANDLNDLAQGLGYLRGPLPDGVGRLAVHIAVQQPHRAEDFWVAAGRRWAEVRAAVARAGALPPEAQ
jgi:hypothetical protein